MNPIAEKMYGKKVAGPDTEVRAGVAVAIWDHEGRILLERRSDNGMWGLPGGGIDPGESVKEAALREIKEETGLNIEITRFVGVYSEPSEHRIVTYPDNGDVRHLVDIILEGKRSSGALTLSKESKELRFFDPSTLPEDIAPPALKPLRDAINKSYGQIR